jgi:hypothetical protein
MQNAETPNGRTRLEEAMALLIQNQATFVSDMADIRRETAAYQRQADERYAQILHVLNDLDQRLEKLRQDLRGQFGFQAQKAAPT